MNSTDTDLLFPPRAIPALLDARQTAWRELVAGVLAADPDSLEQTAFILMMARINNCATCNADSYRAMNGCIACARQAIKRFRGTDNELVNLLESAKTEVKQYLQKGA
jgi:hypothetical protein